MGMVKGRLGNGNSASRSAKPSDFVRDWLDEAACRGKETALFFVNGEDKGKGAPKDSPYAEAKRICDSCPVIDQCRNWVMSTEPPGQRLGMVGGLTPDERHSIHRARQRSARQRERADAIRRDLGLMGGEGRN